MCVCVCLIEFVEMSEWVASKLEQSFIQWLTKRKDQLLLSLFNPGARKWVKGSRETTWVTRKGKGFFRGEARNFKERE